MAWLLLAGSTGTAWATCPHSGGAPTFSGQPINVVFPLDAAGGEELDVLVVMKNTGDSWCDAGAYAVSLQLTAASLSAGWQLSTPAGVTATEAEITNGANGLFDVEVIAPATAGDTDLAFELQYTPPSSSPVSFGTPTTAESVDIVCPKITPGVGGGAGNDAWISSLEAPAEIEVGGQFDVRTTVENLGPNCWTDDDTARPYLVGQNGPNAAWPGPHRHALASGSYLIKPGDVVTVTSVVDAPTSQALNLPYKSRMIQQRAPAETIGYGWFGNEVSTSLAVTNSPSLDAEFVASDLPAVVVAGESYGVEVTMRNSGSETWPYTGTITSGIVLSHPTDSSDWGPSRHALPHAVRPGQLVTFEFDIVPSTSTSGYDALQWKMLEVGNGRFGAPTPSETPEERAMTHRITTSGDVFVIDDGLSTEFVVRGFNHLPFYEFSGLTPVPVSAQNNAWRNYDPAVTEREFRDMARLGANTVRFWISDEYLQDPVAGLPAPPDQATTCERLNHALDTAYKNGLRTVLSLPHNRQLIVDEHCPATLCGRNEVGKLSTLFYEDAFRDTIIDANLQVLEDCHILQNADSSARPPRLFAIEFWQEPSTGGTAERQRLSASREWHEYVVDTHCDPGTTTCCLPTDPGCDVAATLSEAFSSNVWDYSTDTHCGGDPGADPPNGDYLCPPNGEELCTGDGSAAWATMTEEYRRFVDDRAHDAYADAIDSLETYMTSLGLTAQEKPMVTLGFASLFARGADAHEALCETASGDGRGYFLDPRLGVDLFDYASIHLYPWSDLGLTFSQAVASTNQTIIDQEPENRYHQLRFLLDYIRADRPVVMEEVGYNTCNGSAIEALRPDGSEFPDPNQNGSCSVATGRDLIQEEVWTLEAENIARVQGNGALYWIYRDRADRAHWGARRLDDTTKPVYDDIETLFETIDDGRDLPTISMGCIEVDPYSVPNWNTSLMESFDDYLLEASDGMGEYGHVEVRTDACPP